MADSTIFGLNVNSLLSMANIDQSSLNLTSQAASFFTEVASEVPFISLLSSSSSSLTSASAGVATSLVDTIESLDEIQGTITLANGVLDSTIATPFGSLAGTVNVIELANNFLGTLNQVSGTLNLANGIASGSLDLGNENFVGSFNFAQLISNFVGNWITALDGTVAFQNGQIAIDLPTSLGTVAGTIDFGSGQLVADITTPFGAIDFANRLS